MTSWRRRVRPPADTRYEEEPGRNQRWSYPRPDLSGVDGAPSTPAREQHVDTHVIQRILGRAQVSTTRIYTDTTDPLTRDAVDRIGRTLRPDDAGADPASRAGDDLPAPG
jgi:hypothetical protein